MNRAPTSRGEFAFGEPFGVHHTIKNNYIMMKPP